MRKISKKYGFEIGLELGCVALCFALFLWLLRIPLIQGTTTFTHDNYYWNYPTFSFLVDTILNGRLPLWNPYSHGGEPFYPILGQMRFFEPVTLLVIKVGSYFTQNITLLFNWQRAAQILFSAAGVYLVLRRVAQHVTIRLCLILLLFFSSHMLGNLRGDGILNHFIWTPYLIYFFSRIVLLKDTRWRNWMALAAVYGINFQSYFFVLPTLFLLLYFIGVCLIKPDRWHALLAAPQLKAKIAFTAFLLLAMLTPGIVLMTESGRYVYPVRSLPKNYATARPNGGPLTIETKEVTANPGLGLSYAAITYSGTFNTVWNFIQLLWPNGNAWVNPSYRFSEAWGNPSEAYLYLGMIGWIAALIGLCMGRHPFKRLWLLLLLLFVSLSFGPSGGIHTILYYLFPLLRFSRHGAHAVLFITFSMMFFFVLGMNRLVKSSQIFTYNAGHRIIALCLVLTGLTSFGIERVAVWTDQGLPVLKYSLPILIFSGFMLSRWIARELAFMVMILSQMFVILWCDPYPSHFALAYALLVAFPLLLILKVKRWVKKTQLVEWLCGGIVFVALAFDLVRHVQQQQFFFQDVGSAFELLQSPPTSVKPSPLLSREVVPIFQFSSHMIGGQEVRYPELMNRKGYALSPIRNWNIPESISMSHALRTARWDTMYQLRGYQELIYSGINPKVIEKIFAIGSPLLQFREQIAEVPDFVSFLQGEGSAQVESRLETHLFIETGDSPPLAQRRFELPSLGETGRLEFNPISYTHDDMTWRVHLTQPGYVTMIDGYDPYWKAEVDGVAAQILKVNGNFKAIYVDKGEHHLHLYYRPWPFILATILFYLSFLGAIGGWAMAYIREQKIQITLPQRWAPVPA